MQGLETEIDRTAVVLALGSEPVDFGRLPVLPDLSATDLTPRLSAVDARFDLALTDSLPRLRIYALSLTRNGDRADDLVQQTVVKALAGRDSFQTGSKLRRLAVPHPAQRVHIGIATRAADGGSRFAGRLRACRSAAAGRRTDPARPF